MTDSSIRKMKHRVWFHRASSFFWIVFGVASFALGWQSAIALVWASSVYANVKSDWAAGEAADDRKLLEHLQRIEDKQDRILALLKETENVGTNP